ncbi:MAG TPA: electron transport complex protein RnfA [Candidatus Avalokitesvara rifleensis]|uniref:electron transport complex protein RnfA n=1 Tax=Candidatus Avalokitesvara rifleensis TaxID=3367620 RepID=UPI002713A45E|nr:RnfABCDGE type electron transport complex subunit A [Candidatus Brocadiales bacterium]
MGVDLNTLFTIIISAIFVNNYVLARFLGLCPFFGVSKSTDAALGMGMAVTFVMTIASAATWVTYNYVLLPGPSNIFGSVFPGVAETGMVDVLKTISYILIIAALVQLVETVMKKMTPVLYDSLGIYLPLITTNCAILGVALLGTTNAPAHLSILEATVQGFAGGIGFTLALLLMSGVRERLILLDLPKSFRGVPIAFISASMMALAFMGFSGMVSW